MALNRIFQDEDPEDEYNALIPNQAASPVEDSIVASPEDEESFLDKLRRILTSSVGGGWEEAEDILGQLLGTELGEGEAPSGLDIALSQIEEPEGSTQGFFEHLGKVGRLGARGKVGQYAQRQAATEAESVQSGREALASLRGTREELIRAEAEGKRIENDVARATTPEQIAAAKAGVEVELARAQDFLSQAARRADQTKTEEARLEFDRWDARVKALLESQRIILQKEELELEKRRFEEVDLPVAGAEVDKVKTETGQIVGDSLAERALKEGQASKATAEGVLATNRAGVVEQDAGSRRISAEAQAKNADSLAVYRQALAAIARSKATDASEGARALAQQRLTSAIKNLKDSGMSQEDIVAFAQQEGPRLGLVVEEEGIVESIREVFTGTTIRPDIAVQGPEVDPNVGGKTLDPITTRAILQEAGGDPDLAVQIAKERGYIVQ
tara:strand:+ start:3191 stop:4522 length:1332 start_codon:yes stop_codon:yes gene_type:complete